MCPFGSCRAPSLQTDRQTDRQPRDARGEGLAAALQEPPHSWERDRRRGREGEGISAHAPPCQGLSVGGTARTGRDPQNLANRHHPAHPSLAPRGRAQDTPQAQSSSCDPQRPKPKPRRCEAKACRQRNGSGHGSWEVA